MFGVYGTGQSSARLSALKNRASELIIRVPARQLQRIAQKSHAATSLQRETQHFVGVTTVNGLLRIYRSKGGNRLCWMIVTVCCFFLLLWQIYQLIHLYSSRPTVSQVSFLLPESGLTFPTVTICSYNPIRKAYIESVNKTGQFTKRLLDYLTLSFMEVQFLLSIGNPEDLVQSEEEWRAFVTYQPDFTVQSFFWNASLSCAQTLKICSFGGREFDCCAYARGILTDIGKCYQLDLSETDQFWLRRQVQAGVNNGLQIIADFHVEQQINGFGSDEAGPPFANEFETGFRYYVHERHTMPYLSAEGISVSPGTKVYSAISPTKYILLPRESWGNCSERWPRVYRRLAEDSAAESSEYTSIKCKTLCRASYFNELCGCSPYIYNIQGFYRVCSPYEVYRCMNSTVSTIIGDEGNKNGQSIQSVEDFAQLLPACSQCKIECRRWVYHTYNSYAHGFSRSSLAWLRRRNAEWSPGHVRSNFVAINIFYRDMCYTEYKQIQSISMTEILSDIGGNMGLFLGMSLISLFEALTFISKITWIFISKRRRQHLLAKKKRDEEREHRLQATLELAAQRKFASVVNGDASTTIAEQITASQAQHQGLGAVGSRVRRLAAASFSRRKSQHDLENGIGPKRLNLTVQNGTNKRRRSMLVDEDDEEDQNNDYTPKRHYKRPVRRRKHTTNFVDAVINDRLYGDCSRIARPLSSSSSSEENAREDGHDGEEDDELVELKIDLNAWQQGDHRNAIRAGRRLSLNRKLSEDIIASGEQPKSLFHPKSEARRAKSFTCHKDLPPSPLPVNIMEAITGPWMSHKKRKSLAKTKVAKSGSKNTLDSETKSDWHQKKLVVPSLLIRTLKPSIDAQAQFATTSNAFAENANSKAHKASIVATLSSMLRKISRDQDVSNETEAPNLSQIARKHSLMAKSKKSGAGLERHLSCPMTAMNPDEQQIFVNRLQTTSNKIREIDTPTATIKEGDEAEEILKNAE